MAKAKKRTGGKRHPDPTPEELAEVAGEKYAYDQIASEYFHNWIYDQLVEASKLPEDQVLPLETKADAKTAARKMLQQLEWDTKRELSNRDLERLNGGDVGTNAAFWKGFREGLDEHQDYLADELLKINRNMRGSLREGRTVDPTAWYVDHYKGETVTRTSGPYSSKSEAVKAERAARHRGEDVGAPYQGMDMGHALHATAQSPRLHRR